MMLLIEQRACQPPPVTRHVRSCGEEPKRSAEAERLGRMVHGPGLKSVGQMSAHDSSRVSAVSQVGEQQGLVAWPVLIERYSQSIRNIRKPQTPLLAERNFPSLDTFTNQSASPSSTQWWRTLQRDRSVRASRQVGNSVRRRGGGTRSHVLLPWCVQSEEAARMRAPDRISMPRTDASEDGRTAFRLH